MGAVGTEHHVKINFDLVGPLPLRRLLIIPHLKPGFVLSKVGARELVVEKEGDVRHLFENVEQPLVEAAAVDGENRLGGQYET